MKSMGPRVEDNSEYERGRHEALALVIKALGLSEYFGREEWAPGRGHYYPYMTGAFAKDLQASIDYEASQRRRREAEANHERVQKMANAIRKATS